MKRFFSAAALCVFFTSAYAANGVVISMKMTKGASTTTDQIQLDANHMRTEMAGRTGGQNTVVFDGVKQAMYIIDDGKKTYSEITKEDLDRVAAQMQGMMAQLTPEQRAQAEAMMRGRGGRGLPGMGGSAPKPTFKKVGTDKVGKWTCDKYDVLTGDAKTGEICTVDPSALGFTAADFEVTKQLAEFFGKMMPQNAERMFAIGSLEQQGYSGVPVRHVSINGDARTTTELVDVTRQSFPASTFEVPAGYQKEAMFGGRGRG
jgi:uncharacterized protein DUF4412